MTDAAAARGGPAVLVVEDDDETRAALVRELTARGYRVDGRARCPDRAAFTGRRDART